MDLMALIKQAGFTGAAANTMYGIVMAESGGNAKALADDSDDLSFGLAQINMIGDLGPARMQQYGLKSYNDLYDPLTNLKVAYQLSNGGKNFSPWTTFTSGAYLNHAPGAVVSNNSGGGESTMAGSSNPTLTTAQKEAALRQGAGPLYDLAMSVPELKGLIQQAVSGALDLPEFENAVENSKWYRTHSASVRKAITLQQADPTEYQSQLSQYASQVQAKAASMGVTLNHSQLGQMAKNGFFQGWDDTQLQHQLASVFNRNARTFSGQAGQAYSQLQQLSSDYGLGWNDSTIRFRTQQIVGGLADINQYNEAAKQQAMQMFPGLAHQLQAGLTVNDIASPYKQRMADILEVNPQQVNLRDPLIMKALQGDASTNRQPQAMWQFEDVLRNDPRWQYTNNAKQSMSSTLMNLGRQWGFE